MSSKRGGGKALMSGANDNSVSEESNRKVEQLTHGVANIGLDSTQDNGEWIQSRKTKNRAGSSAAKPWGSQNSNSQAWGHQDLVQKLGMRSNGGSGKVPGGSWSTVAADPKRPVGRGYPKPQSSSRGFENNHSVPQPVIRAPLEHGWNWKSRAGYTQPKAPEDNMSNEEIGMTSHVDENDSDEDDDAVDDTDDELMSDDFDSDTSQKSHETRKNNRWFKKLFETLDQLTVEQINEPERQWHCPACQGGPGAIDWFRGLQPLMTHAKTKGSKRVRLHRELAELLATELCRRGTSVIPAGEVFGKWRGLKTEEKDHEIVWPPMVIIMNTKLEQDENEKWKGMGNQELLEYFSLYAAEKSRHSYGPQGHRGMSVLIFESSARGFLEAERLHKHFADQGTDRNAWERRRVLFNPGGERQLYGYLATKEDLDAFNQHSQGKSKLKFEMRSYQEMVHNQIRQMSEDNQQLVYLKNRVAKEQRHSKALEESFGVVTEKLRKTMEENRIVRQRTKMQHEQNKAEMDFLEDFFKQQIKLIHDSTVEKEEKFEKLKQEEREKVKQSVKQSNANSSDVDKRRVEDVANFIRSQDKEIEDFVGKRDSLLKAHEEMLVAMTKRHWAEKVELERECDAELTRLMAEYTPHSMEDTVPV